MSRVFLSFDDLGLGIQFVDALEGAGHEVAWPRTAADVPPDDLDAVPDAVILGGEGGDVQLGKWANAWRQLDPPPAILIVSPDDKTAHIAESLRAVAVPTSIERDGLTEIIPRAVQLRFAAELSLRFAMHATGVEDRGEPLDKAVQIINRARTFEARVIREALRPRIHEYITPSELFDELREARALEIPEVALIARLDGTTTLGRAIDSGRLEAAVAARLLWGLACVGGVRLTTEPPDLTTQERRAVARARQHLRDRQRRLRRGKATYFEVLEVPYAPTTSDLEDAVRRLRVRFAPESNVHLDLGDLTPVVAPLWGQIEKAWGMLASPQARGAYERWLVSKGVDLARLQRDHGADPAGAESDFVAGQTALASGDVYTAVSLFASAARRYPGHADYEAYLAWARYRAAVEDGQDKLEAALRERSVAEANQTGHAPRPRALLALGLLCAACEDLGAARWHLEEALQCDPGFATARQILRRLGG